MRVAHGSNGSRSSSSHVGGAVEGAVDPPSTTDGGNNGAEGSSGDATAGLAADGGSGRDAKLSSLLLLSPGKEYWAGRLAAQGRRDSKSPRASAAARNNSKLKINALGEEAGRSPTPAREATGTSSSSPARTTEPNNDDAPSPTVLQQLREQTAPAAPAVASPAGRKKDYFSFTAGKRGAPLSPSGSTTSSSVWSTQAFTSPGGGGGASFGGSWRGRVDQSPLRSLQKGGAWSPSSPSSPSSLSSSLSPARGGQRRRGLSPAGARVGSAAAVVAHLQAARRGGGAFPPGLVSPAGGGRQGFRSASSARFSPGDGSLGVGFEGRSRSASPLRTKVRFACGAGCAGAARQFLCCVLVS